MSQIIKIYFSKTLSSSAVLISLHLLISGLPPVIQSQLVALLYLSMTMLSLAFIFSTKKASRIIWLDYALPVLFLYTYFLLPFSIDLPIKFAIGISLAMLLLVRLFKVYLLKKEKASFKLLSSLYTPFLSCCILSIALLSYITFQESYGANISINILISIIIAISALFLFIGTMPYIFFFPVLFSAFLKSNNHQNKKRWLLFLGTITYITIIILLSPLKNSLQRKFVDPCYKKTSVEKGFIWKIKDDRVCMEASREGNSATIRTLEGADPETFIEIDGRFFSDKNHLYYKNKVVDANPETFKILGNGYYKDDKKIFFYDTEIDVDYATFEVIKKRSGYAKDKTSIYVGGKKSQDINPKNFTLLKGRYSKDSSHVYHDNKLLSGANPKTFQVLNDNSGSYAKDTESVYYYGKLIPEADVKTFVVYEEWFAKDKSYVYEGEAPLKNLNVKTFEQIENSQYLRDNVSLYYHDKEVSGTNKLNVSKFHLIGYEKKTGKHSYFVSDSTSCGTDGEVVICHGEPITGGTIINLENTPDINSFNMNVVE